MKHLGLIVLAVLAVIGALTFVRTQAVDAPVTSEGPPSTPVPSSSAPLAEARANVSGEAEAAPTAPRSYATEFKSAEDYSDFADSVIDAAKSGDANAQFYLYSALNYCDKGYRFYFDRGAKRRTLDEALIWASTRFATSTAEVNEIYARCRHLKESGPERFGTADDWLQAASLGRHPIAQSTLATHLFIQSSLDNVKPLAERADPESPARLHAEAKRLLRDAIESKDPAVIWAIGDQQMAFVGDAASRTQWAWRLAACERGYDCSDRAEWRQVMCRGDYNCQPGESAADLIHRATGNDFLEIEELASSLNAKIDAGKFDELGLN